MRKILELFTQIFLLGLISVGIYLRFYRVDWNQGTGLHPDEYGLTNTLVQLRIPKNSEEYFNTRLSPLSPYPQYDEAGEAIANGPDNGMRWGQWPMILIRFAAEQTGNLGYDELRLLGRKLSALADTLSILMIFLIGARLYSPTVGLLAACLSSLAVMQIQQSHFMTVDNFATLFVMVAFYACVRIAQQPGLYRKIPEELTISQSDHDKGMGLLRSQNTLSRQSSSVRITKSVYQPDLSSLGWYALFGVSLGLALASKINLLPLAGMVLVAGFTSIADLKLKSQDDLRRILQTWFLFSSAAALIAALTFRLAQPMSFREPSGDTSFFSIHLNPDWVRNMQWAQSESSGIGGGPPGEQWAHRPAILFPWVNMVLWGMGVPLGLMGWAGFTWAAWRAIKGNNEWIAHILPLIWIGGYFFFMGTRWVKSIRYFLPIYPFLALLAAWGMVELWRLATGNKNARLESLKNTLNPRAMLAVLISTTVILGSLTWAIAFVRAVYQDDHTRIQATRWIFDNIPAPFHLSLEDEQGRGDFIPVEAPDGLKITPQRPFIQVFRSNSSGKLTRVTIPHLYAQAGSGNLRIQIALDEIGLSIIDESIMLPNEETPGGETQAEFHGAQILPGIPYYLIASIESGETAVTIFRTVISNETWDEGLPLNLDNIIPYQQLYRGIRMEVRWYDDENKRKMFLDTISQADYILLPSQRAIWSSCRIPRTFPMTMAYYRALFNGDLGFDLAASFTAPIQLGPLQISDVGGTLAWKQTPELPLFNHSLLAAEEAFSVYDHPPVWIFKKRLDYNPEAVAAFFYSFDLSQVVIQGPREATPPPCQ